MPNVAFTHPAARTLFPVYIKIRDVIEGEEAIKGRRQGGYTSVSGVNGFENISARRVSESERYLPKPNPHDTSVENGLRYRMYVERAQWFGATANTLEAMGGQVFERDPDIDVPDELKPLLNNIDGGCMTVQQQMRVAVDSVVAYGRGGLYVDFPSIVGGATQADANAGKTNPVFRFYKPLDIVNWRQEQQGSKKVYTLVVLRETDCLQPTDRFESNVITQYRVLYIDPKDGFHYVEIWSPVSNTTARGRAEYAPSDIYQPLDINGKPFTEIPFTFTGSKNNDATPDKPPLEDMAGVNIGHYRNSAEYEDAVHMLGQPTPYASGLTTAWVKDVWKSKVIPLGSRAVIPLPAGATMGLMQVEPNTLAHEAMLEKQAQMVMLGARLITPQSGNPQTATGEIFDEGSEVSVLTNCANNVAAAYKWALVFAGNAMGLNIDENSDTVRVALYTSFQFTRMSAAERQELVAEWQKGAVSWTELRRKLRAAGIATQPDNVAKKEIAQEQADAIATGIIASPVGVDLPPASVVGTAAVATPPAGQAANPKPPATGKAKVPPAGKGE